MPGYQVLAGMIFHIFDDTSNRIAIYMYVERRHKNRDLYPSFIQILGFFCFLDHDDFAICRRQHKPGIQVYFDIRASEKLKD
jgi:hypothetical protein